MQTATSLPLLLLVLLLGPCQTSVMERSHTKARLLVFVVQPNSMILLTDFNPVSHAIWKTVI